MRIITERPKLVAAVRKLTWFGGLWLGGVVVTGVVAMLIRLMLHAR